MLQAYRSCLLVKSVSPYVAGENVGVHRDDVGVRDVLQMFGRHICCLGDELVVEVGGLVCIREEVNRHGVSVVVDWTENSVHLHFFELLRQDGDDVVG